MSFPGRSLLIACELLLTISCSQLLRAVQPITCAAPAPIATSAAYEYFVSLADHDRHLLRVAIRYRSNQPTAFQIPIWNALYQVRDFAQYVTEIRAKNANGAELAVTAKGKSGWQVASPDGCAVLEYNLYANTPGPFSAQVNAEHVFLNWAQALLYSDRSAPLMLSVNEIPTQWSLHDLGLFDESAGHLTKPVSYDTLVDSPVEISSNKLASFEADGARYRIVVDADPADYKLSPLQDAIRKIVHAEVDWMRDRPFDQYTFLYHFPHAPVGGGMEHSNGTAITAPADRLRDNPLSPIGTTAHEFFHLWNVKRIRPQAMEPVDYEHEQYSRSLWFCEGVTSTASEMLMVRAGLQDERSYLSHISAIISDFESRPAHKFQSPEDSSVEAWMEGRAYYRRPERSVSYYTSGELIGVLLDLRVRERTHGRKSLRDLFQLLNSQYAKQNRYYDDARGIQTAVESVAGESFESFFADYVRGTQPIPYNDFFSTVGLKLEPFTLLGTDAGFDASVNFTGLPEVTSVTPGSAVEAAGVRAGDTLVTIDDREYMGDLSAYLTGHKPGETISFRFVGRNGRASNVRVVLKEASQPGYGLVDLPSVSAAQRAQRAAWIVGDDLPTGGGR